MQSLDNSSPLLVELHRYWSARRGAAFAPARRDIDPIDIPRLLPHLMLVDIVDGGARFRYRLAGTEIEQRVGCRMTGRHLDEITEGQYGTYIHGLYRELLATRSPLYSETTYGQFRNSPFTAQRLMLPLSSDGETIDMVLCGQLIGSAPAGTTTTLIAAQNRLLKGHARRVEAIA
jgi:hypothetical protein